MTSIRDHSFLLGCTLMLVLVASPVIAQQAEISTGPAVPTASLNENKSTAGTGVPLESPAKESPVPTGSDTKQEPRKGTPARTKSTITGLLIIGGVITGIVLLLTRGGGDKTTVISAGTPRVSTPPNQ